VGSAWVNSQPIRNDKAVRRKTIVRLRATCAMALILAVTASVGGLAACSAGAGKEDSVSERGTTESSTESATVQEALRFGGVVLEQ
jgi:hypothetical protein